MTPAATKERVLEVLVRFGGPAHVRHIAMEVRPARRPREVARRYKETAEALRELADEGRVVREPTGWMRAMAIQASEPAGEVATDPAPLMGRRRLHLRDIAGLRGLGVRSCDAEYWLAALDELASGDLSMHEHGVLARVRDRLPPGEERDLVERLLETHAPRSE